MLPSELLQIIVSYLQPHLPSRLVSRSWDAAVQHTHALEMCTTCRVQCKPHNAARRRQCISWNPRWIIRGWECDENPRLFEGVIALTIEFQHEKFAEGQFPALLSTLDPFCIKELVIGRMELFDDDVSVLATCSNLSLLTCLDIGNSGISIGALRKIVFSPYLTKLERLHLRPFRWDARTAASVLSSSSTLANIKELAISIFEFKLEGIRQLAESPYLTNLALFTTQFLDPLVMSSYGARTKQMLINSDLLAHGYVNHANEFKFVTDLTISNISETALDSVLSSSRLESVTNLSVKYSETLLLKNLVTCRWLRHLKTLTVSVSHRGMISEDDALEALSSPDYQLTRLRPFMIEGNRVTLPLARQIANCAHFSTLFHLSLKSTQSHCALRISSFPALAVLKSRNQ